LYTHHHWLSEKTETTANRQTASLVGLVVVLLLLIGGLFLVERLQAASSLEDCLLAGRRDCGSIVTTEVR
jgi:hypothetical protein